MAKMKIVFVAIAVSLALSGCLTWFIDTGTEEACGYIEYVLEQNYEAGNWTTFKLVATTNAGPHRVDDCDFPEPDPAWEKDFDALRAQEEWLRPVDVVVTVPERGAEWGVRRDANDNIVMRRVVIHLYRPDIEFQKPLFGK